jgi:hypothetical protein
MILVVNKNTVAGIYERYDASLSAESKAALVSSQYLKRNSGLIPLLA